MRIAYVSQLDLPNCVASLARILGISQSLAAAGHSVVIIGSGADEGGLGTPTTGVEFSGLREATRRHEGERQWWDALQLAEPDLVISYGGTGKFVSVIRRCASRLGAPRLLDSVEWYQPSHLRRGRLGPRAIDNELSMRIRYPSFDGVIAISSFLAGYYRAKGCPAVVVPPTLDVRNTPWSAKGESEQIRMVYAGTPGRKDLLGEVVRGVSMTRPHGRSLLFEVIGMDADELRSCHGVPAVLDSRVRALGRLSGQDARKHVAGSDVVPLLRPHARYAMAGFPTKVVEAMASGTPVICNLTSDLSRHVIDGVTGYVVPHPDGRSFARTLERMLALDANERATVGKAARQEAERSFDFRAYVDVLDDLVTKVRTSAR